MYLLFYYTYIYQIHDWIYFLNIAEVIFYMIIINNITVELIISDIIRGTHTRIFCHRHTNVQHGKYYVYENYFTT